MDRFKSVVVLVSQDGDFNRAQFNEQQVFDAEIDRDRSMMVGPFGNFLYASGAYGFEVTPGRISLTQEEGSLLSDELLKAVHMIVETLQPHDRYEHPVSGIGMNLEVRIPRVREDFGGTNFCVNLVDANRLSAIAASDLEFALTRMVIHRGRLRYEIRIEPHQDSDGEDLFLGVNVHQDVKPNDDLVAKLRAAGEVREYLRGLCRRLNDEFGGAVQ